MTPGATAIPATSSSLSEAERFRLFVANVTDYAIYTLSPEGIVCSWNAGAQGFKGYTADEIIGQHFSRFYTEEDRASGLPARALQTAIEQGKFEDEGWRVRKDGSRFWASVVIDPIRDETGTLIGFAKITRDITERKKNQEALQASEERFRLLVQGVTDYALYMLSPAGEITNWNSGAERIKGFTQDEVVGTHFSRFYTPEDQSIGMPMKALATAANDGRFESEGWRLRKDGSRFWAHVIIDSIRNDMGELIGFAKITRDITERRNAAQSLEKAQQALFQAQKMEAIGKLTGGIAHDFNNLLSVVVNGIAVLRREANPIQVGKVLDSMERAVTRGEILTQQLLSFARQQPLKQERQNLNRVISSFEAVLRRANRASITFSLQLGRDLPLVMVDAPRFEAALLNLIVNARDATPDDGSISLQTQTVDLKDHEVGQLPAGTYVCVSVADTGHGMSPEVMARAVEPFFTTKPLGQGTGLGLSQVYGFAQQSNGDIKIESNQGKGTVIKLYLPALPLEKEEPITSADASERALVVDDQPEVLDMATELFRTLGYEVFSANNAEDAITILERTPNIEVLFSDVVMPGMSGIELCKKARTIAPDIHVLLASGYVAPEIAINDVDHQDFQFIKKPYRIADIVKKLRKAS